MRFLRPLVSFLLLAALISPAAVIAAKPDQEWVRDSFVDDDFCGTGQTVSVSIEGVINWMPDAGWGHVTETWTNPENNVSVITSFAGGGKFGFIDDGDGAYTLVTQRMGMPVKIRLGGGTVLTRDAGLIIFYDHFDADDEYLGTDVEVRGGPHPGIDPGYDWCDLMVEALGL